MQAFHLFLQVYIWHLSRSPVDDVVHVNKQEVSLATAAALILATRRIWHTADLWVAAPQVGKQARHSHAALAAGLKLAVAGMAPVAARAARGGLTARG